MRVIATLSLALIVTINAADARPRYNKKTIRSEGVTVLLHRLMAQNERLAQELADIKRRLQPDAVVKVEPVEEPVQLGFRNPVIEATIPIGKTIAGYVDHIAKSAKLKDLTPGLATKVAEILGGCETKLISGYRRGARVRGSGRPSLHSLYPSQAADLVGDPKCIYAHLKKWPGGYSVDYARVHHVHVSLGGRERGARFVHYGSRRYASRHRHTGPRRYAIRQEQPMTWERHAVAQ